MTLVELLEQAKACIPNERAWWRGYTDDTTRMCHCPITAIAHIGNRRHKLRRDAYDCFRAALFGSRIEDWNDDPNTTFADLQAAFDKAIEYARRKI